MKILFTFYVAGGGVETLNRQRFFALKKYGIESHALYLTKGSGWKNVKDSQMTAFITNDKKEIQTLLLREQYDLIVVCLDYLLLSKIRALGFDGKIIYDIQGFGTEVDELFKKAKPFVEQNADAIMSPQTPHLLSRIHKTFPNKPLFSFHNGLDTQLFSRKKVDIPNKTIIGWVGRIEENKNWRLFLQIGRQLLNEHFELELWLFEDPNLSTNQQRKQLAKWVKQLHLQDHLKQFFCIPHQEMPVYYSKISASAGFLCSTSILEGFGYAPLEAMSCGCPVLCTDSDGIKSFVFHNRTGKIIPKDNLKKAVSEAKELLTDTELRQTIIQNGMQLVHQEFTLEKYGLSFLNMLKQLGILTEE